MQGVDLFGVCPKCGASVGETVNTSVIDPETISVCEDVSCTGCGYNLRTRPVEAVCPECFTPVMESLRTDELRFADPRWLKRVRRGATLLLVAAFGLIVGSLGPGALGLLLTRVVFSGAVEVGIAAVMIVLVLLLLVAGVLGILAATAPDPRLGKAGVGKVPRIAARCILLLALVFVIVAVMPLWPWANAGAAPAVIVFAAAASACALVCLKHVARRGRRPGLARLSTVLIWLLVAGAAVGTSAGVLVAVQMRQTMKRARTARATAAQAAAGPRATTQPTVLAGSSAAGPDTAAQPNGTIPGTVTVTTTGTGGSRTTMTRTVVPRSSLGSVLSLVMAVTYCGAVILFLACHVIGLVVLFMYRGLLSRAIASAPSTGSRTTG